MRRFSGLPRWVQLSIVGFVGFSVAALSVPAEEKTTTVTAVSVSTKTLPTVYRTTTVTEAKTPTTPARSTRSADTSASDRSIERRQKFYLATDDDIIAADALIDRGLDGEDVASKIDAIRTRILDRNLARLKQGGAVQQSVNELTGALAAAARTARSSDLPGLVDARRDLQAARDAITKDGFGK